MKKTETQTHTCSKCRKDFELTVDSGFKFKPSVVKKLKCTECAWGGPGGMERHVKATKHLQKALVQHFKTIVRREVGCSPGPEFHVLVRTPGFLSRRRVKHNGKTWYSFDFGTFDGAPITLTVEVPTK